MKFNNELLKIPTAFAIIAGGIFGAAYGGYEGFKYSQKKRLIENHIDTCTGIVIGGSCGIFLGGTWPISIPLLYYRAMNDIPFDGTKITR